MVGTTVGAELTSSSERTSSSTIESVAAELGARMLATSTMEARLDELKPDYALVPEWRTSILITSKFEYRPGGHLAICPRACDHCVGASTQPNLEYFVRHCTVMGGASVTLRSDLTSVMIAAAGASKFPLESCV